MADTELRNKWLMDAADAVGVDPAAQITWLRDQRKAYSASVGAGDFVVTAQTRAGRSTAASRGVTDSQQHAAIMAALRYLGADIPSGGSQMLGFHIQDIQP